MSNKGNYNLLKLREKKVEKSVEGENMKAYDYNVDYDLYKVYSIS